MTNSKNKSFILHLDSLVILEKLSDEQAGKLFKAIYSYQKTNEILQLDFALDLALTPFLNQFARDDEKYKITCERRKEAGAKGGKQKVANASKSKQKVANLADSDSKNKSDSDSKNDINISSLREVKKEQFEKDFEEFWEAYNPVKTKDGRIVDKGSKKLAKVAYEKALKKYTADQIFEGTQDYLLDCYNNNRLTCQASVMLNQERFIVEKYQTLDVK